MEESPRKFGGEINKEEEIDAVSLLQTLVKFPTVSDSAALDGTYNAAASWILDQLKGIGLENCRIVEESLPNKPIVVASWIGSQPELPCILLNSHYDVVPVVETEWEVPAFGGLIKDNRLYGRGTQDMKSVCIQYIVALKHMKRIGIRPKRTVHLSFVPDEEIGGTDGMGRLLCSDWFEEIKPVSLAMDEGLASEGESCCFFSVEFYIYIVQYFNGICE